MMKGWRLESARHALAAVGVKTGKKQLSYRLLGSEDRAKEAEIASQKEEKEKEFIETYYDDELTPPSWGVRIGHIEDDMLVIDDWIGASSKKEARQIAKKIRGEQG